jgi:5'-nucleotidase
MQSKTVPYKIFEKGKIRVGVTGVGIELAGLVPDKLYAKTKFLEPIKSLNKITAELKQKHRCDLIICLSHVGYEYANDKISDVKLASAVENVDIVVGGHTHTFLHEPRVVMNVLHQPVTIVQAGWAGLLLGRLDVHFNKTRSEKSISYITEKILKETS